MTIAAPTAEGAGGPVPATSLADVCVRAFEEFSQRPAIRDARGQLTFAELGSRARRIASAYRALGVAPGSRIVLLANNSCQWVEAYTAMVLGGYVRAALLTRLHTAEIAEIALDADPVLVVVDGEWLAENGREWVPSQVKDIVVLGDGDVPEGLIPFDELAASATDEPLPLPEAESVVSILYTSGSTGKPKGVLVTHRTVGARIRNILHEAPLRAEDIALHTAPVSHFSGGISEAVMAAGGLNVLEPKFDAKQVVDAAAGGAVTVLPLVPTMITMVLEELARRGEPTGGVGAVRILPYAGSAIAPDRTAKARGYFGDVMFQLYGASEAQMPITALQPEDHVDDENERGLPRLASAGKPTRYVEVAIVDERRRPLPTGETGEIKTSGEHVSSGYWRQPDATAETFQDGWAYTGDVGYLDEHGYLFIVDRRKDMIISGGFNVYPREVENVISTLAGVREVAVVGAPDPKWGELITAIVAAQPGVELSADEVIAHCRASIGGYKVPKRVEFVDELPKSGVGKVLKTVIRDQLWAGQARKV